MSLTRTFSDSVYRKGVNLGVSIEVIPDATVKAYGVEEHTPSGWEITEVNHGGNSFNVPGLVKWGIFFDNGARTLTYKIKPTENVGTKSFNGLASYDGFPQSIGGQQTISPDKLAPQAPQ